MEKPSKHLMIIAGEASGDLHAAHLVEAIRALDPNIQFSGLGGPQMQVAGVEIYEDLTKIAIVGFWEVLKHFQKFRSLFQFILQKIQDERPDAVILVDYPGFNLRLAQKLKERKVKVIYYISPQVWAWKENRVKNIKNTIDEMLVLFDFEKDFYARHGFETDFVGHPLIDSIQVGISKKHLFDSIGFSQSKTTIGLLPGSREKEIEKLLPPMIEAVQILYNDNPDLQFLLMKAPTIRMNSLKQHWEPLENSGIPLKIVPNRTYEGINASDICMVASGTATLETAILNKPMVVVYKTSLLTYFLAKLFVKIPNIGLVNVVAGKRIVPECIQSEATGKIIAAQIQDIYNDPSKTSHIQSELSKVRSKLGEPGASKRAAKIILEKI